MCAKCKPHTTVQQLNVSGSSSIGSDPMFLEVHPWLTHMHNIENLDANIQS